MRITNNMLINNMMLYMGNNLNRMEKYQAQMATGKKISVPSDDPVVAARALMLRTDVSQVEQYQRNVKDAQSWLDITESTLGSIGDVLQRARELAVQAANGPMTPSDEEKVREEAKQLKTQILHMANTTYAGRYIFSGYKTDKPLVDETTGNFNADATFLPLDMDEKIKFEIGMGDSIDVNVTGGDIFNQIGDTFNNNADITAAAPVAGTLIDSFTQFINHLTPDDPSDPSDPTDQIEYADISADIESFDKQINNILRIRADVGARQNRLELTADRLDNDTLNFTKLMSENENVDMAETIMNLTNEENVYKASLAGGARIIQPSLLDFLR